MKISAIFSDNMILQRDVENRVFGTGSCGEKITITFDRHEYDCTVGRDEKWEVALPVFEAGGPYCMRIASSFGEEMIIDGILFGDVFLLGGQSNMELPISLTLDESYEEVKDAVCADIRMFQVPKEFQFETRRDRITEGSWIGVTPETVMDFSAIGYFFAKEKFSEDGVPVGLVHTAVGGAPIEALMSKENLLEQAEFIRKTVPLTGGCDGNKNMGCIFCYEKMLEADSDPGKVQAIIAEDTKRIEEWNATIEANDPGAKGGWTDKWGDSVETFDFCVPGFLHGTSYESYRGTLWLQKVIYLPKEAEGKTALLRLGTLADSDKTYINGILVGETEYMYPPRRYNVSEGILKSGENIITVRLCMDSRTACAVPDMPYYLQVLGEKIDLTGAWRAREGFQCEALEGPTFHIWHPTALFNSMIAPLEGMRFHSVLFYQGESNCGRPEYYGILFQAMVKEWRSIIGEVPFVYAEITKYLGEGPRYGDDPFDGVRKVQQEIVSKIENAYLVETYDLGQYNELHPQNKKDVAKRFYKACPKK